MKLLAAACAGAAVVNSAHVPSEEPDRFRALTNIGGVKDGIESSATGGHVFTMESTREHTGKRLDSQSAPDLFASPDESSLCERWAVLTSIFDPTDTVRQLGEMEGWCVVVVGDKNGPAEYDAPGVTYLTPEDQEALPYRITSILPWNHFGRKNVGYLYAVHHGAKVIYDVDDDNALIRPEEGIPHAEANPEIKPLRFLGDQSTVVHNPYPCYGGPGNVWPRGFPLGAINEENSVPCYVVEGEDGETRSLGVVQSLANHDPDVDAIYRLTYPAGGLPFDFDGSPSPVEDHPLRVVPDYSMTPYNAQATLHFSDAFWGMLLPVTVHGRVSDIWRSYFTQTLLPSVGGVLAFAPAWVEQIRNAHDYMADFMAERPLYEQSGALATFLVDYRRNLDASSATSMVERVESLAITMYEYGILEEADVELTQAWLQDLLALGYVPPGSSQRESSTTKDDVKEGPGIQMSDIPHKLLVIAVPSIRKDRRDKIRETWLTWGDDRVALRFFGEWSDDGDSNTALEEEMAAHGDLVVLDIEPGMNFALKLLEAMRWMSKNFSFDFFLRLDDDYFLCLDRLLEELDSTLLAIYPEPMPPIYVGSLYCMAEKTRMDEAYLLVSALLVDRVLNVDGLVCGGHGGVTAGYWFTKGNSANEEGDVQWLNDPRLTVYEDWWMKENRKGNTEPGVTNVCKDYIGVHHAFSDRVDFLWPAARDAGPAAASGTVKPLYDFMEDGLCPSLVETGVPWGTLEHDNAQECSSFHAHGGIHYGKEGHH